MASRGLSRVFLLLLALLILLSGHLAGGVVPTQKPSFKPSKSPTHKPTQKPTLKPSHRPTKAPTRAPTSRPTSIPTAIPTARPTVRPTARPTSRPTSVPTARPTVRPTLRPTQDGHAHGGSKREKGLSDGAITGIVLSVFFVVTAVFAFLYRRNHFQYVKRFVEIKIGGYSFLPRRSGGGDADSAVSDNATVDDGEGVHMFNLRKSEFPHSFAEDHAEGFAVNPMLDEALSLSAVYRHHGDSEDSDNSLFTTPTYPSASTVNPMFAHAEEEMEGQKVHIPPSAMIAKYGILQKQSTGHKWLPRFFFIKDNILYYSKKPADFSTNTVQTLPAVLVANLVISTIKERTNPENPLEFQIISPGTRGVGTGGGVYTLQADTEQEVREWVDVIKQCIAGSLSQSRERGASTTSTQEEEHSLVELFHPGPAIVQAAIAHNPLCAGCGAKFPEWASLNLCSLICIDCSGVHRSLGSHLSKVRSLKLDKWSRLLLHALHVVGNENSNRVWEDKLIKSAATDGKASTQSSGMKVFPKDAPTRDAFIRAKYVEKRYLAPLTISPAAQAATAASTSLALSHTLSVRSKAFQYDFLLSTYKQDYLAMYKALAQGVDPNGLVFLRDFPSHSLTAITQKSPTNNKAALETKLFDHSALMLATISGNLLAIELLLQWGANPEQRNSKGFTALDYAQQSKEKDKQGVMKCINELLSSSSNKIRK